MEVSIKVNGEYKVAADVIPAGLITLISDDPKIYTGSEWLDCDGSAVSRTVYAQLYEAIDEKFGPGDGQTTFNLPTKAQARVSPPDSITSSSGNDDDGTTHTHELSDGNVVTAKLSNGAVSQAKLSDSAVSQAKLKTSSGEVSGQGNKVLPGGDTVFIRR
jgi:microcystin-dependent protein